MVWPDDVVRTKKPAMFQCVRTSINGVVKTLVVPINRMDQCIPVVVRGRSGETRRTVVPISSTTVFDTSEDIISGFRQSRRRQWLRYPSTQLPVSDDSDSTSTATEADQESAGGRCRLSDDVPKSTDSEPNIGTAHLGVDTQSCYGAGCSAGVPQLTALPLTDVKIEEVDEMPSGRNLTRSNRISQLHENKAIMPDCQNKPFQNTMSSCDDGLWFNHNARSPHYEVITSIYDGLPTSDMNATPDVCCASSQCSSGCNQETNYYAQSCDDTSSYPTNTTSKPEVIDEELQQPKSEKIESPTNNAHLHLEYADPRQNGYISDCALYKSRFPEVELPPNLAKEETECDHQLPLSVNNDSTTLGHIYQYEVTKPEAGTQESESNSPLLEIHSDEDNTMVTRQSRLPIGRERSHPIVDTSTSEKSGDEAKLDRHHSLNLLSTRINCERVEFDAASALSAHNIRDCVVVIEPLLEPLSSTYTEQETVDEDITQHQSTEMFYSCKQLGPTTIRLARQRKVAPDVSGIPGRDAVRLDTTNERDRRTNQLRWFTHTDIHTTRRHPDMSGMYSDGRTTDTTTDHSRSESEHHNNRTPETQVARGDRRSNFAFSSASTIALHGARKRRSMIYNGVSKLNKSRLKLSRMLQRMAPKTTPAQRAPTMSRSTTLRGDHYRQTPVQDTLSGLSKAYSKGPLKLAESKAYCTKHLEQLLRYHERVASQVRALLRKNGSKTDLTHSTSSLDNANTV